MNDLQNALNFRRIGIATIVAVYLVILVGGIVRASGAGMGCPDWPTCFGSWVPPTDISQLPADYQQIYADRGYADTQFNVVKTWTEYVNRLVGSSTGILIIFAVWYARGFLKYDKPVFYLSVAVLLIISFQGWLGAKVVASNLKPYMITLHMLLALAIVALLIYTISRSQKQFLSNCNCSGLKPGFATVLKVAMALTLIQVGMGVQVREAVDIIANEHSYIERQYWRDDFPIIFYVHRSFSAIILFTNTWLVWTVYRSKPRDPLVFKMAIILLTLIVSAILAGISLDRLGMPPIAQPIHLLMANLIFGAQFFIYICLHYSESNYQ